MSPEAEPINLFFASTFHIATGLAYPEYCAYFLPTESDQITVCAVLHMLTWSVAVIQRVAA